MTIETGKIELEEDAIAPVARGLWQAALEKLAESRAGIEQMRGAGNRIEYEAGWTRFVDSLEEFWTRFFDEGKCRFSKFQPWAGAIDAKRKQDPLLLYLNESRHQSQHSRISMEWEEGKIQIGGGEFFGTIRDLKVWGDGTFEADINATPGSSAKFKVIHSPGNARLPTISNKRSRKNFLPPSMHLGRPLDETSPVYIAMLGLDFYSNIFQQGLNKFAPPPNPSGVRVGAV
jgi:hypothetical protein